MKVILLQDVANVGLKFDVVDVPNGHALNKLIPSKQAEAASPENLKRVESRKAKTEAERTAASESFADVVARITGSTQIMSAEANEQDHLFKGLKAEDISEALTAQGFAISANQVELKTPIKALGEHIITLNDGSTKTEFTLALTKK